MKKYTAQKYTVNKYLINFQNLHKENHDVKDNLISRKKILNTTFFLFDKNRKNRLYLNYFFFQKIQTLLWVIFFLFLLTIIFVKVYL